MKAEESSSITQLIHEFTKGQPYVFVLMTYGDRWGLFKQLKSIVQREGQLKCIRADDIPGAGFDLLEKVHAAIERAELVIAEISDKNPNVFYELGYAVGLKKPVLLLAQRGVEIPSDLRGRELIIYSDDRQGETIVREFKNHLRQRLNSRIAMLRDMLEADRPLPSFIVASPKYPHQPEGIRDQPRDSRTFGDNLGILGLISAFGSIFGETSSVELISAQYFSPELPQHDANLFLIGSPRVNPIVKAVLDEIQAESPLRWEFMPPPGEIPQGRSPVALYRVQNGKAQDLMDRRTPASEGGVVIEDYGIIVRGPHPNKPGRLVMILAGAHSLGTGAACLAATRSALIRDIKLSGLEIAKRQQSFWVLVKGTASNKDGLLDAEGVKVIETGVFVKARRARS